MLLYITDSAERTRLRGVVRVDLKTIFVEKPNWTLEDTPVVVSLYARDLFSALENNNFVVDTIPVAIYFEKRRLLTIRESDANRTQIVCILAIVSELDWLDGDIIWHLTKHIFGWPLKIDFLTRRRPLL